MSSKDDSDAGREIRTGLITAVRSQKNNPRRVSIYVDGEFALGVAAEVAVEHGLLEGRTLEAAKLSDVIKADAAASAFEAAMNQLSYRTRTVEEIRLRLTRKGYDETTIDRVLERLADRSLLDDGAFAREFASTRVLARGEGVHRIRAGLLKHGVDRSTVDEVLAELEPGVDWFSVARQQARGKWRRLGTTTDLRRRRKKLFDFLIRKGFDYSVARTVSEEVGEE